MTEMTLINVAIQKNCSEPERMAIHLLPIYTKKINSSKNRALSGHLLKKLPKTE